MLICEIKAACFSLDLLWNFSLIRSIQLTILFERNILVSQLFFNTGKQMSHSEIQTFDHAFAIHCLKNEGGYHACFHYLSPVPKYKCEHIVVSSA